MSLTRSGIFKSTGAPGPAEALPLRSLGREPAGPLGALEDRVGTALGWRPLCLEEIVERSGVPVGAVVVALDRLEERGVAGRASRLVVPEGSEIGKFEERSGKARQMWFKGTIEAGKTIGDGPEGCRPSLDVRARGYPLRRPAS